MSRNVVAESVKEDDARAHSRLLGLLESSEHLLSAIGEEVDAERIRMQALRQRLIQSRFHLAVLGQFKRGKTTLLNALLGEALLPVAVVPVTSVPTLISWGPKRKMRVIFQNSQVDEQYADDPRVFAASLEKYISEQKNPANRLGVLHVEVEHPSPLVASGVVLIDTPGIGSTLLHNTATTLDFLSECDAALFLVSADPPITQAEVEFLKEVRPKVAHLFFLMNKVDYLRDDDRSAALEFFRRVLGEEAGLAKDDPVFSVSAREGLEARLRGDAAAWASSGMAGVEAHLVDFLAKEKARTLDVAVSRKAKDIAADTLTRVRLKQRTLSLPLSDLETRIKLFDQKLQEAEEQRLEVRDMLARDLRRTEDLLGQHSDAISQRAHTEVSRIIEQEVSAEEDLAKVERNVQAHLAKAIPEIFEPAFAQVTKVIKDHTRKCLDSHQGRVTAIVMAVRQAASELFEIPVIPSSDTEAFEVRHDPYWVTYKLDLDYSIIPEGALDRLLPLNKRLRRLRSRLEEDAEAIVSRNMKNLRWALVQSLQKTFRKFTSDVDEQLERASAATRGAIGAAHRLRIERVADVEPEIERLRDWERQLQELHEKLGALEESAKQRD